MTYKSVAKIDPWPDKCPDISELSNDELVSLLDNAEYAMLNSWEFNFCMNVRDKLLCSEELTERQSEVLSTMLKTLYDNDPALWGSYELMLMDIVVNFNKVVVAGQEVPKPSNVPASEWLAFWEALSEHDPHFTDNLRLELQAARQEIESLRATISDLTAKLKNKNVGEDK